MEYKLGKSEEGTWRSPLEGDESSVQMWSFGGGCWGGTLSERNSHTPAR